MHMPYGMHRVRGACAHFFFNIYNNVTPRPGADGAEVQPRFNQDGVEAERAEVRQTLLPTWAGQKWGLWRPVERLWAGERKPAILSRGCDANSARLVELILAADWDPGRQPWGGGGLVCLTKRIQSNQVERCKKERRGGRECTVRKYSGYGTWRGLNTFLYIKHIFSSFFEQVVFLSNRPPP